MAWGVPPTWTPGQTIPSSNLNVLRDDLLATAAGVATTGGRHIVTTAANAVAEREVKTEYLSASGTTTSTSFTNLTGGGTGPTVTITTGVLAIVNVQCQMNNSTTGPSARMSYDITGATTSAATDDRGTMLQTGTNDMRYGVWELQTLTAGSNVFVAKYRVSSTTGNFSARTMIVWAL